MSTGTGDTAAASSPAGLGQPTVFYSLRLVCVWRRPICAGASGELAQGEAAEVIFQIQVILRDPPCAVVLVFYLAIGGPVPSSWRIRQRAEDPGQEGLGIRGVADGGRLLEGGAIGSLGSGQERGRGVARGQRQRGPPRRDARSLGGEVGPAGARGAAGQRRLRLGAALGGAVGVAVAHAGAVVGAVVGAVGRRRRASAPRVLPAKAVEPHGGH